MTELHKPEEAKECVSPVIKINLSSVVEKIINDKECLLLKSETIKSIKYSDMYLNVNIVQVFDSKESSLISLFLEQNVQWVNPISSGKRVNCTYGDDGLVYEIKFGGYGGRPQTITRRKAISWDSLPILKVLNRISTMLTNQTYNFCVAMCYPTGKIGINPHKDKEMTRGTTICGWSFGSERNLIMGPPVYIKTDKISISLPPGSVYEFVPPTNDYWTHCIEKNENKDKRISLTFRNYKNDKK